MSSIAVTGSATGTGVISLLAPVTNTNRTINLPDSNGTIVTSATAGVPIGGPAFSAYAAANQSITSGVLTKVTLNAEVFDTASCFDSTTNYRFTPNVAGYYQINAGILINAATSFGTFSIVNIFKNGSVYKQTQYSFSTSYSTSISDVIYMNGTTDYLELYGQINGGTGVRFEGSANLVTWMSGALIRSAT